MKDKIHILDCTLRDGGYVIDWMFGKKNIISIIENLIDSNIDFVECGFLKNHIYDDNKTFFNSINNLKKINLKNSSLCFMINFEEYALENFNKCDSKKIKIRVAFKKHQQKEAIEYINQLIVLGWDVFVNPMSTNTYSNTELLNLIFEINKINPFGIFIVDTLGNMYENQLFNIFKTLDTNLNKNITIGFHSHNSMQLSFSNTKAFLEMNKTREIIIDSSLYGMGRGAGNLCTEVITKYLNDNYQCDYKIKLLLQTIDNNLKAFYIQKPWGYSTPYYIAAINGCHPNYATTLIEEGYSNEDIDKFLNLVPVKNKTCFNPKILSEIKKSISINTCLTD